jgi:adenylosuccinate synthase
MMKKTIGILCSALLLFGVAGCAQSQQESDPLDGVDESLVEEIQEYESFADEYASFMEDFAKHPQDLSLVARFGSYSDEIYQWSQKVKDWTEDGNLTDEQISYINEIIDSCQKKIEGISDNE